LLKEERSLKKCLHVADALERKYGEEIKEMVKRVLITLQREKPDIWVSPLTLTSIFQLISPSHKHLKSLSFIYKDLEDIIEKLSTTSFKVSIRNEVFVTLSEFQEMLIPNLEKYKVFSSIKSPKQKNKVVFYLLLRYLPEIIEEIIYLQNSH